MPFDQEYWEARWKQEATGWDIGYPSTPIAAFFDQFQNKEARILIPGCGNAWEGEYLLSLGFQNTYLLDIAPSAVKHIRDRVPSFPTQQVVIGDFFALNEKFDVMVEQTFFCALDPTLRADYTRKAAEVLKDGGILVGLLFDHVFGNPHPPFGGNKEEYLGYFEPYFHIDVMETCRNSIKPRQGNELFILLTKK